jgi:hypothetical protein
MKKSFLIHAAFLCLLTSCNKSVDNSVADPPVDTVDNRVKGPKGSLSHIIFIDPLGDTTIFNYLFDDKNYLLREWYNHDSIEYKHTRDEEKRVIKIAMIAPWHIRTTNVYYNNANEIAYVIDSVTRDTSKEIDSLTFEYTNGRVTRINTFSLQTITYKTYEYAGSNISKIRAFYLDDGIYKERYTEAYDYEYDDKINPFFTPDDIRFLDYGALSANNIIQTTRFDFPGNVATSEFTYGSDNKPISEIAGTGGVVNQIMKSLYFYY